MLSVTAKPFHPVHGTEVNAIIYVDGIPSCCSLGSNIGDANYNYSNCMSEFTHSIADEAIDEAFPPSAQEAAELEAVEIFVEMMANLAHLEEREDVMRFKGKGLGKRWMARRELRSKPRPPKHSIRLVDHNNANPYKEEAKSHDIVVFDAEKSFHARLKEQRILQRQIERMTHLLQIVRLLKQMALVLQIMLVSKWEARMKLLLQLTLS